MLKGFFAVGLVGLLTGCATIVSGSSQTISVESDPAGAECVFRREGTVVARVVATPGLVELSKSKEDVGVTCSKPGHQTVELPLNSDFQGATLGNIILGGFVGVAIDAGSGAMNEYPEKISVVLPPESFESLAARDGFFDPLIARAKAQAETRIAARRKQCGDKPSRCDRDVAEIEQKRDQQVRDLEAMKARSAITPPEPAVEPVAE